MEELRANLKEAVELWLEAGSPEESLDAESQILELVV